MRRELSHFVDYQFDTASLDEAARLIQQADGLIITAGAGLGVDSGLSDYRTFKGMYTHESQLQLDESIAIEYDRLGSAQLLETHPAVSWNFHSWMYRHFQNATPHIGYTILLNWCKSMPAGYFAFTSNVDGYFARAGFAEDRIFECHGSMHRLQCIRACEQILYSTADAFGSQPLGGPFNLDYLPRCKCGRILRPNAMMFDDLYWLDEPCHAQYLRMDSWIEECRATSKRLVAIELGAGKTISRVRDFGERQKMPLIRVNPELGQSTGTTESPIVHIQMNALDALEQLEHRVRFE